MLAFQFSLLLHYIKRIRQHFRSVLLGNMIVRDELGLHYLRHADAQSIRKSYPGFFRDFTTLGGSAHVLDLG